MKNVSKSRICFYILSLLLAFISTNPSFAEPKIHIAESTVNFGDQSFKLGKLTKDLTVKNLGTDTLIIISVRPGCGCTVAPITSNRIAPGDSATIAISLDIKNFSGQVTKSITVTSNDPKSANSTILLNCNVLRPFSIKPKYLSFDKLIVGEPTVVEIQVVNTSAADATVKNIAIDNSDVTVNIKAGDVLKSGKTFNLKATAIPTKTGVLQALIKLQLAHPDEESLEIRGYGHAVNKQ